MLTRFAPSPTGYLHIGNARTALICWLYANRSKGKFLLRFDDTDNARSTQEYYENIIKDLRWLGIDWDGSFKQSERLSRYDEVFNSLLSKGYIYSCYESKEELDNKRNLQIKQGKPPVYDRKGLYLTDKERIALENDGKKPHYRFRIDDNFDVEWYDEVKGNLKFLSKNLSDPVVRREDGTYTYMLPSVIDDVDYNITHIIRGEDHVSNTAIQIHMFRSLGYEIPSFAHLSLLFTSEDKISKRVGGSEIRHFRDIGLESMTINSYLSKLGTSDVIEPQYDIIELINSFDITHFNQAQTKFYYDDLATLNARVLKIMPFNQVKERLFELGIAPQQDFWDSIKGNIKKFSDAKTWWDICKLNNFECNIESINPDLVKLSLNCFPQGNINDNTWKEWTNKIKENSNFSPKEIFMNLRVLLTGSTKGPELAKLLPIIGRENIIARLKKYID